MSSSAVSWLAATVPVWLCRGVTPHAPPPMALNFDVYLLCAAAVLLATLATHAAGLWHGRWRTIRALGLVSLTGTALLVLGPAAVPEYKQQCEALVARAVDAAARVPLARSGYLTSLVRHFWLALGFCGLTMSPVSVTL